MKIGFIGLGIMGESMCENIIKKHDDTIYVFDIVTSQVELLVSKGAKAMRSAKELAKVSDVIISMVPKSEDSMALYQGILGELKAGKICIDMSTISPEVSVEISKMVAKTGAVFADAPVVKSKPAAISGDLGIYVGSSADLYQAISPILSYMGKNIIHMGDNGMGLVMKVCHNTLVAQIQNGVNETLTLSSLYGIDIDNFVKAVSYGGGQNFYLDSKANSIKADNFAPVFSLANMQKDLKICEDMAQKKAFTMEGQQVAQRVYDEALAKKLGSNDFSASIKVVRERVKK